MAAASKCLRKSGSFAEQVLAVVQDKQGGLLAEPPNEARQVRYGRRAQACRCGHGTDDEPRVGHRGEVHERGPVRVCSQLDPSGLDGEPGLSTAARATKSHNPVLEQQPADLSQLQLPPHEGGERHWQIGLHRRQRSVAAGSRAGSAQVLSRE